MIRTLKLFSGSLTSKHENNFIESSLSDDRQALKPLNKNYLQVKPGVITILITLLFLGGLLSNINAQDNMELVGQCAASAGDNLTYLKDFQVKLDAGTPGGKAPDARFSMVLSKNTAYRFTICTAPDSDGEAILQLYELNKKIASSFNEATGQEFSSFDFKCQKTGVYHIFIKFKDGKAGEAVGIMSFIERL